MAKEETEQDATVKSWAAWLADHGLESADVMEVRIWPAVLFDRKSWGRETNRTGFWMEAKVTLGQGEHALFYKGKTAIATERRWIEVKSWPPNPW